MQKTSVYTNNAVFQLSLSSKELFHSNFLYWLATDNTLNPHQKGSSSLSQNFFNQLLGLLGSSLANTFNLSDYAVFREYEHFDFSIWEKKRKSTKSGRIPTGSAQDENEAGEEHPEDNEDEQNDNASKEVSYEGTCDTKELEKVVLVLENKFKSIPYQEQLDFYAGKVLRINHSKTFNSISNKLYGTTKTSQQAITEIFQEYKKGCNNGCTKTCKHLINFIGCEFFLLTLAQQFPALDSVTTGGLWKIVNYTNYANCLKSISLLTTDPFTKGLIEKYVEFIGNFSNDINYDINNIKETTQLIDVFKGNLFATYRSIRMHDIWQKLVMSKLVLDVKNAFPQNINKNIELFSDDEKIFARSPRKDIFIGTGYGTGGAFLEIKYLIEKDYAFIVQIQDNCYRRGILYVKPNGFVVNSSSLVQPTSSAKSGAGPINDFFVTNSVPQLKVPYPNGLPSGPIAKNGLYKFNAFGSKPNARIYFQYQYVGFGNATIGNMINAIVDDICKVIQMYPK